MRKFILIFSFALFCKEVAAQRMLDDIVDSVQLANRNIRFLTEKFGNLSFSGYMQPQFQVASENGTKADYQGGEFGPYTSNRFRLRRGRLRADYSSFHKDGLPATFFVFQFDGTEQGVNIRDFWGRYYENKFNLFAFSAGMMARPFSYELLLSSGVREAPERGRMSQILMKTERDLGVMITLNPHMRNSKYKNMQLDAGIYNGQGLAGTAEFDDTKDLVSRFTLKPTTIMNGKLNISAGTGLVYGNIVSQNNKVYAYKNKTMAADSLPSNKGRKLPRHYYGADVQLSSVSKLWQTIVRAEIMYGKQTATFATSATPGTYPVETGGSIGPLYTRNFTGGYFHLVQNIGGSKNELLLKYDFYDPNSDVKGAELKPENGFSWADIKYQTIGMGYQRFFNDHMKLVLYYDIITNEPTQIPGFEKDKKDNIFTARVQFMF